MNAEGIRAVFRLTLDNFDLDVDLQLPGSGISAIFGASGSGKTSLLRCMAGLEKAEGVMQVNGTTWQDGDTFLETHERSLGYVFQESSLLPHLTAMQNLEYAMKRASSEPVTHDYNHILAMMELAPLLDRYPAQLSGGERQRVAIARALLVQPKLLLMDEPLASLDTPRKQEIMPYLERMHEEFSLPVVYVSHALEEVTRLADHLVVLDAGSVGASGPLRTVLAEAEMPMGEDTGVVVEATIIERDEKWHLLKVGFSGGELWVRDNGGQTGRPLRVRILARDVSLVRQPPVESSIQNTLPVEISQISEDVDDAMALVQLRCGDDHLLARLTRRSVEHLGLATGDSLIAQIKAAAIVR